MVTVYNCNNEDFTSEKNNFYIGKGSPLENPFGIGGKRPSKKKMTFPTRDEALNAFRIYFESAYGVDEKLTKMFDEIYELYKKDENIYLQCFCKPLKCHGDILVEELQKRLVKEKLQEIKKGVGNK